MQIGVYATYSALDMEKSSRSQLRCGFSISRPLLDVLQFPSKMLSYY